MKDKKLVINDKVIYIKDNPRKVVMDKGSKGLVELYSLIVSQNKGDILDVGFGMGFSANKLYENCDSYTCIEINYEVYKKALEWAKDKPNTKIYLGDWVNVYDVIPKLTKKFDGIFMDTYDDPNHDNFEEYAKLISNEGCILSMFNYFACRDKNTMNGIAFDLTGNKFMKNIENHHIINWTIFKEGEFIKTDNKFKTFQNKVI